MNNGNVSLINLVEIYIHRLSRFKKVLAKSKLYSKKPGQVTVESIRDGLQNRILLLSRINCNSGCKIEFYQPSCWLYSMPNLLIFQ